MTNRVLLGNKDGTMGIWISRPGNDVLTAAAINMLLSSEFQAFQILQTGTFSISGTDGAQVVVDISDQGFQPLVITSGPSMAVTYNSTTQIVFTKSGDLSGGPFSCTYKVLTVEV